MNILFLTLVDIETLNATGVYEDLLREIVKDHHQVYIVSPVERRKKQKTHLITEDNVKILKIRTLNTIKASIIEKGISTVLIESLFLHGVKKYFSDIKFDLVLYSTPPITLAGPVAYVKKRDHARTYLLLKDIFPQNAVDIGMLKTEGVSGLLYRHFRNKEKKLYRYSDRIGCMSEANVRFVVRNNPEVDPAKVEVCPNALEEADRSVSGEERVRIREKYGIPQDKKVFAYGGNFGKPQNIPHIIACLKECADLDNVHFLLVGSGTDYPLLESYVKESGQKNVSLRSHMPRTDYEKLVASCDVGLIFLDYRFTIPNFPSRLMSYMQAKIPVLACTDPNTDVGEVIVNGGFGRWCVSNDPAAFKDNVVKLCEEDLTAAGLRGYKYMCEHYNARDAAQIVLREH